MAGENDDRDSELDLDLDKPGEGEDRGDELPGEEGAGDKGEEGTPKAGEGEEGKKGEGEEGKKGEGEGEGYDGPNYIPKARFDDVIERAKRAEEMNQSLQERLDRQEQMIYQLQQGGRADPPPDKEPEINVREKRDAMFKAIAAGEYDEADKIWQEIDEYNNRRIERLIQQQSAETADTKVNETALQQAAKRVMSSYPIFHKGHKDFNPEATKHVVALRDYYIQQEGLMPAEALERAAEEEAPRWTKSDEGKDGEGGEKGDDKEKETPEEAKKRREAEARRTAAKASNTPPPPGGAGGRSKEGELDVFNMSEEEFDKLSEKQKAELRGDAVES